MCWLNYLKDSFVVMQYVFLSVRWQTTVLTELMVVGEALHILLIKIYLLRDVSMTGRAALFFLRLSVFFFSVPAE